MSLHPPSNPGPGPTNSGSYYNDQFRGWANSPHIARFWQGARERKWLYLIAGVLIGTLFLLAMQRLMWRGSYVVPVRSIPATGVPLVREPVVVVPRDGIVRDGIVRDPVLGRAVVDPVVGRPLNFPARALNNDLPAYPSGAGGQVMPFVNRTDHAKVVKEAFFHIKNAGRPMIPGVAIPAYELRFEPKDFDIERRCYARAVNDLKLPANSETRVVVRVVDGVRANERIYGALVLRCEDGELIQFENAQVIIQPD